MALFRSLFCGFVFVCCVQAASAEVIRVSPDPCPLPADAVPYQPETGMADDASGARWRLGEGMIVFYDIPLADRRFGSPFVRVLLDAQTGLPLGATRAGDACTPTAGK